MPPFTARMSGDCVILAYPEGGAFYLVKVGLVSDLRREFDGLQAGHAAFPVGVPRPLAHAMHRTFPTLVTTGVAFEPIGTALLRRPSRDLEHALAHYFATASRAFRVDSAPSHASRIREAFAAPWASALGTVGDAYVDAIVADVDGLPAIRQHGDFYLGNLGVTSGNLAIFDWEDFGREWLPGLDLAQLLLSANDFDIVRLREQARPGGPHRWVLAAGCETCGVTTALFAKLLPAYIALLGRMKSELGYGDAFTGRALRALRDSLALASGDPHTGVLR